MKIHFLIPILFFISLLSCEKDSNCSMTTCWGNGSLDTKDCKCNCDPGFTGDDCSEIDFQQGTCLTFDTYFIDYMETASPEDVVIIDGIKMLKKGADPLRIFNFTNTCNSEVFITSAKGNSGAVIPKFPYYAISSGGKDKIEIRYDTNRSGEKLAVVDVLSSHGNYRLTAKVRVAE